MAVTFTRLTKRSVGSRYVITGDLALDNSYPAGGYAVTPATFGHRNTVTTIDTTISGAGFLAVFVPSSSKIKFFKVGSAGALTECASTDLNTDTIRLHVTGK